MIEVLFGTPVAEHFILIIWKHIYIYMLSLYQPKRGLDPKLSKETEWREHKQIKKYSWFSPDLLSLFSIDEHRLNNWGMEILLYLHLNIQIHLCRIFISSLTIWVMADLNLINQIIFEDISIPIIKMNSKS